MKQTLYLLLILFVVPSCQKGDSTDNPPALSSQKSISAVIFKATDNPSLSSDITASLSIDSVKAEFPQDVSLASLIPTISFTGASIAPANKTVQNFINPVSYTITAQDGSTRRFVFAMSNQPANTDSVSLLAQRWKYIKDSSTNIGNYYFLEGNSALSPIPGVYFGNSADYWEFRRDSSSTVHINNQTYQTDYILHPNNKLEVVGMMVHGMASVIKLTATEAIFDWNNTSPNGGVYFKRAYLRK